jgi:hypothetical protein
MILEVKELRVGNYVDFEYGEPNEKTFGFETIIEEAEELVAIEEGIMKCRPIKLNEEWLLKFGFESYYKDKSEFQNKNLYLVRESVFWRSWKHEVIIQYVHQLQNLYFALTNKELTIKKQ